MVTASLRDSPGIAFGDVVGANVALSLVALGVAAIVAPLPLRGRVRNYALGGIPLGAVAVLFAWDGDVGRIEGAILVALYFAYVAAIWVIEKRPPALGETDELIEAVEEVNQPSQSRIGRELFLAIAGVVLLAAGSIMLVEAVKQITDVEATQTRLGITLVGFATAFELVVLAWSAARHRAYEAALAGVVGSFAYNSSITLGAGALARPLTLADTNIIRSPLIAMPIALLLPLALAVPTGLIARRSGIVLIGLYIAFVIWVLLL